VIETSQAATEPQDEETPASSFDIETAWFEARDLSFDDVVQSRMCSVCRGKLGTEVEERTPIFDKETGRMRLETVKSTYGTDPLKVIHDHCGKARNYITRDMPTLEAVFRVLLANNNQPLTVDQIRDQLAEWCPGGGCQWLLLPREAASPQPAA
jgi:hypothetical protein